jgi:hypothetical protein
VPSVKKESSPTPAKKRRSEGNFIIRIQLVTLVAEKEKHKEKDKTKDTNVHRRSTQSISSTSSVLSSYSPESLRSVSPAVSSKRSSYCSAPEEWNGSNFTSPRIEIIDGLEANDLEDIFNSTLSIREPVFEDAAVDNMDLPYLDFFLQRMPQLMSFVDLFPSIVRDVFARSFDHPALRHSILSISTMLAPGCKSLDHLPSRHYYHKQRALQLLQKSLGGSPRDLGENDAISIFLLLWLDVNAGSSLSATQHLRGLYQVLQQVQNNTRESTGGFGGVSALLMLIWRSAYR